MNKSWDEYGQRREKVFYAVAPVGAVLVSLLVYMLFNHPLITLATLLDIGLIFRRVARRSAHT